MKPQAQGRSVIDAPADLRLDDFEGSSIAATLVVAADARILAANARMRRMLGLGDAHAAVSARLTEFLVDPDLWTVWRDADYHASPVEIAVRDKDGAEQVLRGDLWARGEGSARRIVAVLVDAAESRALRAVAQHSARMEALGSLTAGIAHDFNNLLTVLVGNLYLIGEELRDRPKAFEKLKAARDAGKRGTDLIKQLMTFARRETLEVGIVDPARVVENIVPLLRRALGTRITLETSVSGWVRCRAGERGTTRERRRQPRGECARCHRR